MLYLVSKSEFLGEARLVFQKAGSENVPPSSAENLADIKKERNAASQRAVEARKELVVPVGGPPEIPPPALEVVKTKPAPIEITMEQYELETPKGAVLHMETAVKDFNSARATEQVQIYDGLDDKGKPKAVGARAPVELSENKGHENPKGLTVLHTVEPGKPPRWEYMLGGEKVAVVERDASYALKTVTVPGAVKWLDMRVSVKILDRRFTDLIATLAKADPDHPLVKVFEGISDQTPSSVDFVMRRRETVNGNAVAGGDAHQEPFYRANYVLYRDALVK